jgi:transmembrane sensor
MTAEANNRAENLIETAADWFARRRSGHMSLQEARELEAWLDSDVDNREAFLSVCRSWVLVQSVATDPEVLAMREVTIGRMNVRRLVRNLQTAAATILVLAAAAYLFGLAGWWRDWTSTVTNQRFQTAIGQTVTVSLADGSSVTLDSNTLLVAHETWRQRDVSLLRGQALFHVAKDSARPFIVSAADSDVTATGTAFDVRLDPDRLTVLLTEGKIHVVLPERSSQPAMQSDMVAGWQLIASNSGERKLARLSSDDQARALGWTTRRLSFVRQSLSSVAAELNRYSLKKIVVAPDLALVPIDGVFLAGDIDGFVRLLVKSHLVRVQNDTDSVITLASLKKSRSGSSSRVHDF